MYIDSDSHYTPASIFQNIPTRFKDAPRLIGDRLFASNGLEMDFSPKTIDLRIHAMREAGFDKQCLNVGLESIPEWWISKETELYLTQKWNDEIARICKENDCFIPIGQVPHRDPEAASEEAERCVKDLGFPAIGIEGHWGGKNIASEEWHDFFGTISKLDVPIMSHPCGRSARTKFDLWMPGYDQLKLLLTTNAGLLGFVVQHMISMVSVIELGILDKYPNLKIAWMETDVGWVPGFMEMVDGFYNTHKIYVNSPNYDPLEESQIRTINLRKKPSQYFKDNFYYSINFATDLQMNHLLPLIINEVGLGDKIFIQTDFDHNEGDLDILRVVKQCKSLSEEEKEKIGGKNVAEFLKLKWEPSKFEQLYA